MYPWWGCTPVVMETAYRPLWLEPRDDSRCLYQMTASSSLKVTYILCDFKIEVKLFCLTRANSETTEKKSSEHSNYWYSVRGSKEQPDFPFWTERAHKRSYSFYKHSAGKACWDTQEAEEADFWRGSWGKKTPEDPEICNVAGLGFNSATFCSIKLDKHHIWQTTTQIKCWFRLLRHEKWTPNQFCKLLRRQQQISKSVDPRWEIGFTSCQNTAGSKVRLSDLGEIQQVSQDKQGSRPLGAGSPYNTTILSLFFPHWSNLQLPHKGLKTWKPLMFKKPGWQWVMSNIPFFSAITFVFCQKRAFSVRVFTSFSQNNMWSRIPRMPGETGKLRCASLTGLDCWQLTLSSPKMKLSRLSYLR